METILEIFDVYKDLYNLKISKNDVLEKLTELKEVKNQLKKIQYIDSLRSFNYFIYRYILDNVVVELLINMGNDEIQLQMIKREHLGHEEEKLDKYYYFNLYVFNNYNPDIRLKLKEVDIELFTEMLKRFSYCHILDISSGILEDSKGIFTNLNAVLDRFSSKNVFDYLLKKSYRVLDFTDIPEKTTENVINWLLQNPKTTIADSVNFKIKKQNPKSKCRYEFWIGEITHVYEANNYRISVINYKEASDLRTTGRNRIFAFILNYKNQLYNYMDAGRILVYRGSFYYYHLSDANHIIPGQYVFMEDVKELPALEILDWMLYIKDSTNINFITETDIKFITKNYAETLQKEEKEKSIQLELEAKLTKKMEELKNGKPFIINGITFNKDSIIYENQVLSVYNKSNWTYGFLKSSLRVYSIENINWDNVFDLFIAMITYDNNSGKIGEVEFDQKITANVNKLNIKSEKCTINGYRINKDELKDCLRRALCFTNQNDYNNFLKNVSSCSLKFHRYLQNGLTFSVSGLLDDVLNFTLPLERRKNLMYIVIGEKAYKIKDTNRLIALTKNRYLSSVIDAFLTKDIIENITIDDIKFILDECKKEYTTALERSEKLLKETEERLNLTKQTDIQLNNSIVVKQGYIIEGKLNKYVVEISDDCKVFEYPSGRYICIVDKSMSQVGKDKLINRLYALKNDNLVAGNIHTLR